MRLGHINRVLPFDMHCSKLLAYFMGFLINSYEFSANEIDGKYAGNGLRQLVEAM